MSKQDEKTAQAAAQATAEAVSGAVNGVSVTKFDLDRSAVVELVKQSASVQRAENKLEGKRIAIAAGIMAIAESVKDSLTDKQDSVRYGWVNVLREMIISGEISSKDCEVRERSTPVFGIRKGELMPIGSFMIQWLEVGHALAAGVTPKRKDDGELETFTSFKERRRTVEEQAQKAVLDDNSRLILEQREKIKTGLANLGKTVSVMTDLDRLEELARLLTAVKGAVEKENSPEWNPGQMHNLLTAFSSADKVERATQNEAEQAAAA